ncbi:MAG: DUF5615 family PIN-like protein [Anaerolineae bacterium]|nr:DUF5615 family PIN-like protein [Anaerolineae bacterium]
MSQVRYLFDEDCNARILRGIRRRAPGLYIVTTHDVGFGSHPDPVILAFAATEGLVVVSHDVRTMTAHAATHLQNQQSMAGLILIPQTYPVGHAIEDLLMIAEVSTAEEWHGRVVFLPL